MTPRRLLHLIVACSLLALVASGCGEKGEEKDPAREGIATDLNGLDYNVFMTRQINPKAVEDKAYFSGEEESPECARKPGSQTPSSITPAQNTQNCPNQLYGLFIQVCNQTTNGPVQAAREATEVGGREFAGDFEIEDAQGNKFEPVPLPEDNVFAYRSSMLKKGDCIPASGSAASTAPTGGALLVFRIPVAATENRPLELSVSSGGQTQRFELDL